MQLLLKSELQSLEDLVKIQILIQEIRVGLRSGISNMLSDGADDAVPGPHTHRPQGPSEELLPHAFSFGSVGGGGGWGGRGMWVLRNEAGSVTLLWLPTRAPWRGWWALLPAARSWGSQGDGGGRREGVQSLTLGAVTCPKQGFLVLTVICEEEGHWRTSSLVPRRASHGGGVPPSDSDTKWETEAAGAFDSSAVQDVPEPS